MSELATNVDAIRDAQRRLKWVLGQSEEWIRNETHQLVDASSRLGSLAKRFENAAGVFTQYAAEMDQVAQRTPRRRLSLYDSRTDRIGLDQARALRLWIAETDGMRCASPYQRMTPMSRARAAELHKPAYQWNCLPVLESRHSISLATGSSRTLLTSQTR